jgi:hypothetical protein
MQTKTQTRDATKSDAPISGSASASAASGIGNGNGAGGAESAPAPTGDVKPETGATSAAQGTEHDDEEEHEEDASGRRVRKRRPLGVDPSLIISDGRSKRRRTPSPAPVKKEDEVDPRDVERAVLLGREIFDKIMASKDSE